MKKRILILSIVLLALTTTTVHSQNRMAIGGGLGPSLCFTDLSPGLDGLEKTSPRNWDLFNFQVGARIDYELDAGLAFSTGIHFSRKRFGFIHDQSAELGDLRLWGHSELYAVTIPVEIAYAVLKGNDPYFELLPFLGVSGGKDFSSYRNMTRLDENSSYNYTVNTEVDDSYVITLLGGVKLRTIIDQLGMMDWKLTLGRDLTELPSFDYEIIPSTGDPKAYSQDIKLNYISLGMTLYLRSWDIINGSFMRRR